MPFKCYDREFELDGAVWEDGHRARFNMQQTNSTKISLSGTTFSIKQSLTFDWKGKPETTCTIECQDANGTLQSTLKDEEVRCKEAYKTVAEAIIKEHSVGKNPKPIGTYLGKASADELGKAFESALAFFKTDGPQASTTQGEAA